MAIELERLAVQYGIRPDTTEVVGAAAARLGTTPRMLRYRESLGLLAPARTAGGYRTYDRRDPLAASRSRWSRPGRSISRPARRAPCCAWRADQRGREDDRLPAEGARARGR